MPAPIKPNGPSQSSPLNLESSGLGMGDLDLAALLGGLGGGNTILQTADANDPEADILFSLWQSSRVVQSNANMSARVYAVAPDFPQQQLMRLRAHGLIDGDQRQIRFTDRAARVIRTLVLGEHNTFRKDSVKKPYSVILADSKRLPKKTGWQRTAQDAAAHLNHLVLSPVMAGHDRRLPRGFGVRVVRELGPIGTVPRISRIEAFAPNGENLGASDWDGWPDTDRVTAWSIFPRQELTARQMNTIDDLLREAALILRQQLESYARPLGTANSLPNGWGVYRTNRWYLLRPDGSPASPAGDFEHLHGFVALADAVTYANDVGPTTFPRCLCGHAYGQHLLGWRQIEPTSRHFVLGLDYETGRGSCSVVNCGCSQYHPPGTVGLNRDRMERGDEIIFTYPLQTGSHLPEGFSVVFTYLRQPGGRECVLHSLHARSPNGGTVVPLHGNQPVVNLGPVPQFPTVDPENQLDTFGWPNRAGQMLYRHLSILSQGFPPGHIGCYTRHGTGQPVVLTAFGPNRREIYWGDDSIDTLREYLQAHPASIDEWSQEIVNAAYERNGNMTVQLLHDTCAAILHERLTRIDPAFETANRYHGRRDERLARGGQQNCPRCGGTGTLGGEFDAGSCPLCAGDGFVPMATPSPSPQLAPGAAASEPQPKPNESPPPLVTADEQWLLDQAKSRRRRPPMNPMNTTAALIVVAVNMHEKRRVRVIDNPSSSSSKTYQTILYEDGTASCNCNGWLMKKNKKYYPPDPRKGSDQHGRSCKHTDDIETSAPAATVRQRPVSVPTPTPAPARMPTKVIEPEDVSTPSRLPPGFKIITNNSGDVTLHDDLGHTWPCGATTSEASVSNIAWLNWMRQQFGDHYKWGARSYTIVDEVTNHSFPRHPHPGDAVAAAASEIRAGRQKGHKTTFPYGMPEGTKVKITPMPPEDEGITQVTSPAGVKTNYGPFWSDERIACDVWQKWANERIGGKHNKTSSVWIVEQEQGGFIARNLDTHEKQGPYSTPKEAAESVVPADQRSKPPQARLTLEEMPNEEAIAELLRSVKPRQRKDVHLSNTPRILKISMAKLRELL